MARNCLLNVDGVALLGRKVAGDLSVIRTGGEKFDITSYTKKIYSDMEKLTGEPVNAYTIAQLVPHSVSEALDADRGLKKYYRSKKFINLEDLADLSDRWLESIDNVIADIGVKLSNKDLEKLYNLQKQAGVAPNRNTPDPQDLDIDLYSAFFAPMKSSWYSTTSNELITRTPAELLADETVDNMGEAYKLYAKEHYKKHEGNRARVNPEMAIYFDFIRDVLNRFDTDISLGHDSKNIKSTATPNGFVLTIMSNQRIPATQIDDNTQRYMSVGEEDGDKKFKKSQFEKGLSFVVTNEKGEPLYFKIDKTKPLKSRIAPSNKKEGKMIYYTLNSIKHTDSGVVDYGKSGMLSPDQVVENMLRRKSIDFNNKPKALAAVKSQFAEQENMIGKINKYIGKDPKKNQVRGSAIGGSNGSVANQKIFGIKGRTSLSKFNFEGQNLLWDVVVESGEKKGRSMYKNPLNGTTLIKTGDMKTGVPVYTVGITSDSTEGPENSDAGMIASFLVDDIYKKGKKLTVSEKVEKISPFVRVFNKDFEIRVKGKNLEIVTEGEILTVGTTKQKEKAREVIFKFFSEPYISNTERTRNASEAANIANNSSIKLFKEGDPEIYKAVEGDLLENVIKEKGQKPKSVYHVIHKRTWNIDSNSVFNNTEFDNFTNYNLVTDKHGIINIEYKDPSKPAIKYQDWVIEKGYTYAKPNVDGHLSSLNGYFTVEFEKDDVDAVEGKRKPDRKKVRKIAEDLTKKRIKNPVSPTKEENPYEDIEGLELNSYQKNLQQNVTPEQLEKARKWYPTSPLSKKIPFEVAFGLANTRRPNAVAEWSAMGGILLNKGSDYTDTYHEAWHGFTQMFLNQKQQFELYEETSKLQGSFIDYRGNRIAFSSAGPKQLEEYLAEEFRSYMIADGKTRVEQPVRKNIFQYILDALKALFTRVTVKDVVLDRGSLVYIHDLFEKLRIGDIGEFTFNEANANFKVLDKGVTAIKKDPREDLSYSESKLLVDTIDSIIGEKAAKLNKNPALLISNAKAAPITYEKVVYSALEELLDELNEKHETLKIDLNDLKAKKETKAIKKEIAEKERDFRNSEFNLDTVGFAVNHFGDFSNKKEIVERKGMISYHLRKTRFLLQKEKSDIFDAMTDEADIKRSSHTEKGAQKHSLEALASSDVILMLKSIYKPKDITNRLGYREFEDDKVVWNSIAKVLEGVDGKDEMYNLILENSTGNINPNSHVFEQLAVLLGSPMEAATNLDHRKFARWEEFKQAFDRLRVALTQVTIDKIITSIGDDLDGDQVESVSFTIHSGETTGRHKNILRQWETAFKSIPGEYIVPGLEGSQYLDLVALFKDPKWAGEARLPKGTEFEFLKAIGIRFTDHPAIREEITDSAKRSRYGINEIYKELKERIDEEADSIVSLGEVFEEQGSRLNLIAELEAKYNPTAGFMATTASGATQFEHAQQSSATRVVTGLNDAADFADATARAHMGYLAPYAENASGPFNFFTRGSRTLDSLFKNGGIGAKKEWKGQDVRFEYKNFSGIALTVNGRDHDSGVDAASADETTKLLADIFTFMQLGVSEGARVSDRGTTSLYFTSHVAGVPGANTRYHSGQFYIDPVKFLDTGAEDISGKFERRLIMTQYLSNELLRIQYMNGLSEDAVEHKIIAKDQITGKMKSYAELGKEFVIFHDILTEDTKKELKEFDYKAEDEKGGMGILYEQLEEENPELFEKVKQDIDDYFEVQYEKYKAKFNEIEISDNIRNPLIEAFNKNSKDTYRGKIVHSKNPAKIDAMINAHIANSWMHMYEGMAIFYGDMAIYGGPDNFIKRITGSTSPGLGFSNDASTKAYFNNLNAKGELKPYLKSKWFTERENASPRYDSTVVHTWDGVLRTAIFGDTSPQSAYLKKYEKVLYQASKERLKKLGVENAATIAKAEVKAYTKMDEGDGQGWITFDSYRILKKAMGEWSDAQEVLFQRILRGDNVPNTDVKQFFPVAKYQYFGPLGVAGSSIAAFHKFSLMPLIPTVIKGTELEAMHNRMSEQNINYSLFQTGSKIATYTSNVDANGNPIPDSFREGGNSAFINPDYEFTVNPIFLEYLKDQMAIPDKFKNKVTFSTQLRKIIEIGYMENGLPVDFMVKSSKDKRYKTWNDMRVIVKGVEDHEATDKMWRKASKKYQKISDYRNQLSALTEVKKHELLRDAGLELNKDGSYKGDIRTLLKMVQDELLNQDMAEHEADYIEIVKATDQLKNDLSFSPSAEKIEKILVALVNKRLINQKVNGEGLVLVSDAGFQKLKKPTKAELAKWGTSGLTFYDIETDKNGKVIGKRTSAMKVKIAMKGSFEKLLTHPDVLAKAREEGLTRLEALNALIKDDKWLDKGENRKMITMVGVRIPVQGLNSTEFMEVYEFLPKEAGSILIPPADMVAKSGSDFDIDKLMVMMPNLVGLPGGERGLANYKESEIKDMWKRVRDKGIAISEYRISDGQYLPIQDPMVESLIRALFGESYQEEYTATELDEILKAERIKPYEQFRTLFMVRTIENDLINSMTEMLAEPDNFVNLIRPNGTYYIHDIADDMAESVRDYDPNENVTEQGLVDKKGNKLASPTRAFELLFNLYKHQAHSVGKQTLGIMAVENAMNVLFNGVGAHMSPNFTEKVQGEEFTKEQKIYVPHNTLTVNGNKTISLSDQYDANGIYNIADLISQLINGAVDVAKDTWIFDIQGNKEVAPTLLFMLQAGIPLKTAIYIVSNPLVRQYIKEQKIAKSKFGEILEQGPSNWRYFRNFARGVILGQPEYGFNWKSERKTGNIKTLENWKKRVSELEELWEDGALEETKLYNRIKDKDGATTDVDRAAFLQFIDIEEMAGGTTDVKMKMNFDTKKTTTTFAAMNKQALIDELMTDGKFPGDVVRRMVDESPIGSFNIQKFIMELWSPLFKLRNNPAFLNFIHNKTRERTFSQDVESTFGEGQSERFTQQLRNDFAVFIYQNALKKFDLTKETFYKGYTLDKKVVLNQADIPVGAFVKKDVMYVDDAQIKDDYTFITENGKSKKKKTQDLPESYDDFGFADVRVGMFTSLEEYRSFVIERAYLLSVWELDQVEERGDYKRYLEINKKNKIGDPEMVSFQEVIRDMAMDNTFNTWKTFKGPNNAAYELERIKVAHPELLDRYPVLKALIVSQSEIKESLAPTTTKNDAAFKNIRLLNPNLTGAELSMYHDNLLELANDSLLKVSDPVESSRLSNFFKRLPYITIFQSGLDINTMYGLGRLMPYQDLQLLIKKASNSTEKLLNNPKEAFKEMQTFYLMFVRTNGSQNYRTKGRFKDYLVTQKAEQAYERWNEKKGKVPVSNFIQTDEDGNKTYDPEMIKTTEDAKRLAAENPEYLFIYDAKINPEYKSDGSVEGAGGQGPKNIINQLLLGNKNITNSLGVPIRFLPRKSGQVKDHPTDKTPKIMEKIDIFINTLNTRIVTEQLIPVFPKGGLAQGLIRAENLTKKKLDSSRTAALGIFDHLSKALTKYGYKNNNYRFTQKGKKFLLSTTPVTNQDIEYQMFVKCASN